jgi:hypothetical protein
MSSKLYKSFRKKCQGCAALLGTKSTFTCDLGVPVNVKMIDGVPTQPTPDPAHKCYKPKNTMELRQAKKK